MINRVLQRPVVTPIGNINAAKAKETTLDNIQDCSTKTPTGTSRAAGLRRRQKDRPDLYEDR